MRFLRSLRWVWNRLSDIQTVEWLWKGGISTLMSAVAAWLGIGHLRGWQLLVLFIGVFVLTMAGLTLFEMWRRLRVESKLHPLARLAMLNRTAGAQELPQAPPGTQPEHIRRDLDGLIKEGEGFAQRRLSIEAAPLVNRVVPESFWSWQVIEWRGRSVTYLKHAGIDSSRFAECSPQDVKTLNLDQVRCHIERLRESL